MDIKSNNIISKNKDEIINPIKEINCDKISFRFLNLQELLISLDRLTRFKYPYVRKKRVYLEILSKCTISPKISLKNYYSFPLGAIEHFVKIIWDYSVQNLYKNNDISENIPNLAINIYLSQIDIETFSAKTMIEDIVNSENVAKFAKSNFLIDSDVALAEFNNLTECEIIDLLIESGFDIQKSIEGSSFSNLYAKIYQQYQQSFPLNISQFLDFLSSYKEIDLKIPSNINSLIELNKLKSLNIKNLTPSISLETKLLIIVEGITEEKLLPVFAKLLDLDFETNRIKLIGAGGKNQVIKLYKDFYEKLNIPILLIFDLDAKPIADDVNKFIRNDDRLFLIPNGEFEDILDRNLIIKAINNYSKFNTTDKISETDFEQGLSTTAILYDLWKEKGFGEFSKSEFATIISENITDKSDVSSVLEEIFYNIKSLI